jgi:hypothetical protein
MTVGGIGSGQLKKLADWLTGDNLMAVVPALATISKEPNKCLIFSIKSPHSATLGAQAALWQHWAR